MAIITENSIEKIRLEADIVSTVSDYVNLKKKGVNFFGLCPFHDEKTPSFSVNESKQIFKCFGCGAGGGVFNFIMDVEKVDFVDAIKILADKNGIEIEYKKSSSKQSKSLSNELLEIHDLANKLFIYNFEKSQNVIDYLKSRKLKPEIIKEFEIGLSIDSYDQVLKFLQKRKFSSNAMKSSGLFVETKKGYIDRFRNRIIFPIHDSMGRVIAFAGRATNSENIAKYMNSPETPIYNKSRILYGLWKSKKSIVSKKSAIVVEGYMDFLKMYQSGFNNVVAVSGTSFTEGHAIQLKRLCNTIFLLYDGDDAGKKAAIKTGYMCLRFGLDPRIVEIPDGIDPDDWISDYDSNEVVNKISKSLSTIEFHFKYELKNIQSDVEKAQFVNKILLEIKDMDDPIYQELQIKKISDVVNIDQRNIILRMNDINKGKKTKFSKPILQKVDKENNDRNIVLEQDLIKLCFSKDIKIRNFIYHEFDIKWLTDSINKDIFDNIYIHLHSQSAVSEDLIINNLNNKEQRKYLTSLLYDIDSNMFTIQMVKECVMRLKKKYIAKQIEELRLSLKDMNQKNDVLQDIIIRISDLERELNEVI
ncbi:MAG: DNA primase [Pelagibacteraceae bacterium TMED237]|nr:DNA primase [Candidatus Neomarinimicrobiota bacterium]OUW96644.1 MAG: DNA primase [Pelagibacteraceae bacterium TMED237]|tara:strand:- start:7503 stop:9263 length:1761 start_codon:yes stop_codon:yes gene_type:complete